LRIADCGFIVDSVDNKSAFRIPHSALIRWLLKPAVFLAGLGPVAWLIWAALTNNLSANPLEDLTHETGVWTLRFLCVTLSITPLRRLTGWNALIRFRRMTGLFAFFYGVVHFLRYVWFTVFFDLQKITDDVLKRPFITVGFLAFVLMIPLAITSTKKWISRLGGKRWQFLHKAIYVTGILGVIHYIWRVKSDIQNPLTYAILLTLLLGYRLWHKFRTVPVVR